MTGTGTPTAGAASGGVRLASGAAADKADNTGTGRGGSAAEEGSAAATTPPAFRSAIESLERTTVREEIRIEPIRAPQRLAPHSYALAADVLATGDGEAATGRLVLLHDPDGGPAWNGELRLVAYASAEIASDMAGDPLLPEVGWSWLIGALADRGADFTAAGGTVTQTTSTRFGDSAGPSSTTSLELRASWTPISPDLSAHLLAFTDALAIAAGLPPEGVTVLGR